MKENRDTLVVHYRKVLDYTGYELDELPLAAEAPVDGLSDGTHAANPSGLPVIEHRVFY